MIAEGETGTGRARRQFPEWSNVAEKESDGFEVGRDVPIKPEGIHLHDGAQKVDGNTDGIENRKSADLPPLPSIEEDCTNESCQEVEVRQSHAPLIFGKTNMGRRQLASTIS